MTLSEWAEVATIASGAGTVAGVILAVVGLVAWRLQKYEERRAEVAAGMLVATERAADALLSLVEVVMTALVELRRREAESFDDQMRAVVTRFRSEADDTFVRVREVSLTAALYLRPPEPEATDSLTTKYERLRKALSELLRPDTRFTAEELQRLQDAWAAEMPLTLDLKFRAHGALAPTARLQRTWWGRVLADFYSDMTEPTYWDRFVAPLRNEDQDQPPRR